MSTIPKSIQDKINSKVGDECNPDSQDGMLRKRFAYYGYKLATDGREELEKENATMNKMIIEKDDEILALKNKVNGLIMDNMTHEYNNAEAEKFAPEYKRQIEEPLLEKLEELKAENEKLIMLTRKLMIGGS